jgi:hypothetical protein
MLGTMFGPKCPDCGKKNSKDAGQCSQCGKVLGSGSALKLNENRWEAWPDTLAVFFTSNDLKGLFAKPLRVPTGMRACVLQNNVVTEFPPGEYAIETLFERMNSFFQGQYAEILIVRQASMPIALVFDDVWSADLLKVRVESTIFIKLGEMDAFRNHFMRSTGAVSTGQLGQMIREPVKQIIQECIGKYRLAEMIDHGKLRQEVNRALRERLTHRLDGYGLAFDQVDTLSLRHDRMGENAVVKDSLWVELDEARQQAEHKKALNEIYSQSELDAIAASEVAARQRYRRGEMRQDEAEQAHVLRLRELDLYEKVAAADTRKQVIHGRASDQVATLEAQLAERKMQREHNTGKLEANLQLESDNWQHLREQASIKCEEERRSLQRDYELREANHKVAIAAIQARAEADEKKARDAAWAELQERERQDAVRKMEQEKQLAELHHEQAGNKQARIVKGMQDLIALDQASREATGAGGEVARLQEARVSEQRQIFEQSMERMERMHGTSVHAIRDVAVAHVAIAAQNGKSGGADPVNVQVNTQITNAMIGRTDGRTISQTSAPRICNEPDCGAINVGKAVCCSQCGQPL